MIQQIKLAIRSLVKRPRYALMVLAIMALCIGGNASVFSIAKAVLFQDLPYKDGDRLIAFSLYYVPGSYPNSFSYPEYRDWKKRFSLLDELSAFIPYSNRILEVGDGVERIGVNYVVPSYLKRLGINPEVGRLFSDDENGSPGSASVAIISYGLWNSMFGRDLEMVGGVIQLDDLPYTVVGVMPEDFFDLNENLWEVDAWLPAVMAGEAFPAIDEVFEDQEARFWDGLAIMGPGVSLEQLKQEAHQIMVQLKEEFPQRYEDYEFSLTPIREFIYDDLYSGLQILLWGGGLVLLLGCANIANLLLARFAERKQEFAMHLALGASRWQLVRFSLLEAMILSLAGGTLGAMLAAWGAQWLPRLVELPPTARVTFDGQVLLATAIATVLTGVLFAIPAAVALARMGGENGFRSVQVASSSRSVAYANRQGIQVVQIAVVVLLLLVAGLLLQSFLKLHSQELGFEADSVLAMRVAFGGDRFDDRDLLPLAQQEILDSLEGLAGVEAAGFWGPGVPGLSAQYLEVTREDASDDATIYRASAHIISRGAVAALGVPVFRGREFSLEETPESPQAVLINRSLGEALWPGENPVGKRIRRPERPDGPRPVIVGVISDARLQGRFSEGGNHLIYLNHQLPVPGETTLLVRASALNNALVRSVRERIRQVDASLPTFDVASLRERLDSQESSHRLNAAVVGLYSGMALVFALLGLYGMQAYSVIRRTREIGLRVALGAMPRDILRLIMAKVLSVVGLGLLFGVAAAFFLTRFLEGVLYGSSGREPVIYILVIVVFGLVALLAALIPARRALQVQPMRALQAE